MVDEGASKAPQRVNVTIRVNLKYPDRGTFVERFSQNLSRTGIFIRAKDPVPVGSKIRFDYHLGDSTRIFRGVGLVRWVRTVDEASEPSQPPGMGIEFVDLDPQSEELVNEMVALHGEGALAPKRRLPKFAATPTEPKRSAPAAPNADIKALRLDQEEQGVLDALIGDGHDAPEAEAEEPPPVAPRARAGKVSTDEPIPEPSLPAEAEQTLQAEQTLVLDLCGAQARAALATVGQPPDEAHSSTVEARFVFNGDGVQTHPTGLPLPEVASWLGQRWPSAAADAAARRVGVLLRRADNGSIGLLMDEQVVTVDNLLEAMVRKAVAPYLPLNERHDAVVVLPSLSATLIGPTVQGVLERTGVATARIITEDVAMLDAAGLRLKPDEYAITLYVGALQSRLTLRRGSTTAVASVADPTAGLAEVDFVATEQAANALYREHEIDVDDDPELRNALHAQITAKRRNGDSEPLCLEIAGAVVEVSHESFCEWTAPVTERLSLMLDHLLRNGQIGAEGLRAVVVGSDEPLWPGCAASMGHLTQVKPTVLERGSWCRVLGASRGRR